MDLFESAISFLRNTKLNKQEKEIIKNYVKKMNEKSSYIAFLNSN